MKRRTKTAIKALHPKPKTWRRKIKNATRRMQKLLSYQMVERITCVSERPVRYVGLAEQIAEAEYELIRMQIREQKLGIHGVQHAEITVSCKDNESC